MVPPPLPSSSLLPLGHGASAAATFSPNPLSTSPSHTAEADTGRRRRGPAGLAGGTLLPWPLPSVQSSPLLWKWRLGLMSTTAGLGLMSGPLADLITAAGAVATADTPASVEPLLPPTFSLRARRLSRALSAVKSSTFGRIRRGGSTAGGRSLTTMGVAFGRPAAGPP